MALRLFGLASFAAFLMCAALAVVTSDPLACFLFALAAAIFCGTTMVCVYTEKE